MNPDSATPGVVETPTVPDILRLHKMRVGKDTFYVKEYIFCQHELVLVDVYISSGNVFKLGFFAAKLTVLNPRNVMVTLKVFSKNASGEWECKHG